MEGRREPFLGTWGWVIAAGLALVALAHLIAFFNGIGEADSDEAASYAFYVLGAIVAGVGLAAAGLWARDAGIGVRTALVIAGAYFLLGPIRFTSLF